MGSRRKKREEEEEPPPSLSEDDADGSDSPSEEGSKTEVDSSHYEQARNQRIKENMERMQKLGLFDLSLKLKPPKENHLPKKKKKKTIPQPNNSPQRRSSRIMSLVPIDYSEGKLPDPGSKENEVEIFIPEGTNPEVYTEEHEKLLGDCESTWELCVDGYDEDGNRMYDPIKGQTCHQCRQKTLAQHTNCNKCELLQGQFCGDCLYMRYGENVIEANHNTKWVCPPCRGICNCSRCRRGKGWMPTGNIYSKVSKLGFKSVAHYLIKTRLTELGSSDAEEISETSADTTLNIQTRTRASKKRV
ncbi:unnamed protein product [Sphenostylis stenocarpa]|uniref:Zinc-finger domain-containing protein n=1 Tax=Sphenostylis stenocarpa TaxID=92480 RepID=A0AA86V7H3_9FABA|nr:unnamed protein product [Sphenostylis stenocarpa]